MANLQSREMPRSPAVAIVVALFLYKLRIEEAFMRETFPDQYPGYAASVPRLIPFTKPRQSAPR